MRKKLEVNSEVSWHQNGFVWYGKVEGFSIVKNGLNQRVLAMIVSCSGSVSRNVKQVVMISKDIHLVVI
jgi:hypothetical protein